MTRKRNDGPTGRRALDELETRLGALFDKLGAAFDAAAGGADGAADKPASRKENGPLRAEAQVRVRFGGITAASATEATGRGRPADAGEPARAAAAPRKPVIEIDDGPTAWSVTVEMPGADPATLEVCARGGRLLVSASGPHPYRAEIGLPKDVDPGAMERELRNGILEISMPRRPDGSAGS